MSNPDWLTARPVAHRGLHNATHGVIENTPSSVAAAIAGNYGIEVDLQITADGEAMVHHDEALGRLTEGDTRLDMMTAAELKHVPYKGTADRMMDLGDLCDLVAGRATLVLELKSHFDGDSRLPVRVANVLKGYRGAVAVMSFDPAQMLVVKRTAPRLRRGLVAERYYRPGHQDRASLMDKMTFLKRALRSRPQFLAYSVKDLATPLPLMARRLAGLPLLTWTVRTEEDRRQAARFADQMIFEGFRP